MKRFFLLILDILILYASLILTLFLRYGKIFEEKVDIHLLPFSLIFIIWLLIFYIANLYDSRSFRNNPQFYSTLSQSIGLAAVISIVFFYLIPYFGITPKTNLFIFIIIFAGLEIIERYFFNEIAETKFKKPVLIVGLNPQSVELAKFIKDAPQLGYNLKYVIDISPNILDKPKSEFTEFEVVRGIQKIRNIIQNERINTVIISPEAYQIPEITEIFYRSLENKINFYNLSTFYERLTGRVALGAINQIWFLENLSEGRKKFYETIKRGCDILGAAILAFVFLLFYPFVALAIKLSSSGPIFFRQKRVGQKGEIFELIKFRSTFRTTVESTAGWEKEPAHIYTKFGKFMRSIYLDEIPQIINVLKGEMSFTGPRPERPEFVEELAKNIPYYRERLLVKPGITGWAQINIRIDLSAKDAMEKLQYDLFYIKNRSLMLDASIMLKTIRFALKQSGK